MFLIDTDIIIYSLKNNESVIRKVKLPFMVKIYFTPITTIRKA